MFGLFLGCVCLQTSRTLLKQLFLNWWWKFVFMFSGMTQRNKEFFLYDCDSLPPRLNHKILLIQTWSWSRILFLYWGDPLSTTVKEFWSGQRVSVGTTDRNFFTCQYTLLHFLWVSWLSPSWETSTERHEWKWHIYLALSPFIPF